MPEANSTQVSTANNGPQPDTAVALPGMRVSYDRGSLHEDELAGTWFEQLQRWLDEAQAAGLPDANAMVLATADAEGRPSSRSVLCKGLDQYGVVFYTNYTSAKSHDLLATRYAAATFPWYAMQRQVNVRGEVERVSSADTAEYWSGRPRGSQIGAWASPQSRVVDGRRALEKALAKVERQFADTDQLPVPPHWGGWRIRPDFVEFWQGRRDRMHDRLRFRRVDGSWHIERLAP
ncbi:MAG: pyridoxamine 5'-phosphate oxidase [Pseudonocardiaceae bacterium]|nr:pyridoxamine 5'-phosphate oxidase [Pseudonocardiaceae bacterium]